MKEFILTQSYSTIEEMLNSGEVAVYKDELKQGNIDEYAIVSRVGNRYDLQGNKIANHAKNPFLIVVETVEEEKEIMEENKMKYVEIETLIDNEIEKAVAEVNARHEKELAELKEKYTVELENAKAAVKAEIIAKING